MKKAHFHILLSIILLYSSRAPAETAPQSLQWELGASLAALQIPLYPGSKESKGYLLPLPYVIFRSDFLEIDEGIRAKIFQSADIRLNLSADFGVPVNSDDSDVRVGMTDLSTVLQVGPLLEITLGGSRKQPWHLRLELPARFALATDFKSVDNLGLIYEPRLTYETRRPFKTGFAWQLTAGLRYASDKYHAYYYDVPAQFATPTRAEFKSGGGYSGFFSDVIGNWRYGDLIYWAFVRYQNLSATEFEQSPLVEQQNYYFFGVGMTWVFAHSL
ncbi:MAG: MipA/OmpV family protein [Gammaproteobacteria bacterium]